MTQKKDMDKISDTVSDILKNLFKNNENFLLWKLKKKWPDIAGDTLSSKSYIAGNEGDVLLIHVTNSVWMQELFIQKKELLKKLQKEKGCEIFKDIRFFYGEEQSEKKAEKSEESIFKSVNLRIDSSMVVLLSEEKKEIQKWVNKKVKKTELRSVFVNMITETIKKRKAEEQNGYHSCSQCGNLCRKEEKICPLCRQDIRRKTVYMVMIALKQDPQMMWNQLKKYIPCTYDEYEEGRQTLIYRYVDNIFYGRDTKEDRLYLACMLTHRSVSDMKEGEPEKITGKMTRLSNIIKKNASKNTE